MAERAAHLVDSVLPDVPIRQWVLSVPYHLRYRLAWDHDLCRAVAGVMVRSIIRVLGDRARDVGIQGGRGGAVVIIQRFGGALNLNVHFHALVPDGVFAGEPGKLTTGACACRSPTPGATGRRTLSSRRWSSSSAWPCWCRGRAST
jgi:hypothetical protein